MTHVNLCARPPADESPSRRFSRCWLSHRAARALSRRRRDRHRAPPGTLITAAAVSKWQPPSNGAERARRTPSASSRTIAIIPGSRAIAAAWTGSSSRAGIHDDPQYPGYVYHHCCVLRMIQETGSLTGAQGRGRRLIFRSASPARSCSARFATARRILSLEHSLKLVIEERRRMAMTGFAHRRAQPALFHEPHATLSSSARAASAATFRCR